MDIVDMIIAYEQGELQDRQALELFSKLIKSGQAWSLQGSYGRMAKHLIELGYIDKQGNITEEGRNVCRECKGRECHTGKEGKC